MTMTNLERSLIAVAERELAAMSTEGHEGSFSAALRHFHAVMVITGLIDMDDSGLDSDAAQELLRINCEAFRFLPVPGPYSFASAEMAPALAEYIEGCYVAATASFVDELQRKDIKRAMSILAQLPPDERTLENVVAGLEDKKIQAALRSVIEQMN